MQEDRWNEICLATAGAWGHKYEQFLSSFKFNSDDIYIVSSLNEITTIKTRANAKKSKVVVNQAVGR